MKREDLRVGGTVYVPKTYSNSPHGTFEITSIGRLYARTDNEHVTIDLRSMRTKPNSHVYTSPIYRSIEEYIELQNQIKFINGVKNAVGQAELTLDQAEKIQAILEQQQ